MKLSYASHQEVLISKKYPTVIGTNNPTVYYDLLTGLSSFSEKVKVLDDQFNELEVKAAIDWQGDPVTSVDLNSHYESILLKQLQSVLTEEQRKNIHDVNNQIYTTVQECLFMIDLPLEVTYDWDLKRLFKYCKIHFSEKSLQDPYVIIESILKIHLECGLKSCVGLTNVAHYLNQDQIQDLNTLAITMGIPLIMIEFTEMKSQELYGKCDYYYIDEDFVDWHQ